MWTTTRTEFCPNGKVIVNAACLSTDAKRTSDIANGSTCIEMDTGKLYFFDQTNNTWREWE